MDFHSLATRVLSTLKERGRGRGPYRPLLTSIEEGKGRGRGWTLPTIAEETYLKHEREEEGGGGGLMNCSEETVGKHVSNSCTNLHSVLCVYSDSLEEAHQFHLAKKRKKEEMLSRKWRKWNNEILTIH